MQNDCTTEEWRPVRNYEGLYSVSNIGRVRSDRSGVGTRLGLILRTHIQKSRGYATLFLSHNGIRHQFLVHRLVVEAIRGPYPPGLETNHRNGDKLDNRLENLEYVTAAQNTRHAVRTGLRPGPCGERNTKAKLTNELVRDIRNSTQSAKQWAKELGLSQSAIYRVKSGRSWRGRSAS